MRGFYLAAKSLSRKLFVESLTLRADQVMLENLAMRTDGVYSFQAGGPLLRGLFSKGNVIIESKESIKVEGYQKVIYKDHQDKVLVIWEEGMELPVIDVSPILSNEDILVPGSYDRQDPGNLFKG